MLNKNDSSFTGNARSVSAIDWLPEGKLKLLDQRKLPTEEVYIELSTAADAAAAIKDMVVRGAPAIGITAAYGVVLSVLKSGPDSTDQVARDIEVLAASRPTAVNLFWALDRMKRVIQQHESNGSPVEALLQEALLQEAQLIHEQDIAANKKMGASAVALMRARQSTPIRVLTHCNTGALATGGYGTALGVVRRLQEENVLGHVYADETRPWLQGARLTAWELVQEGIPVTLNADVAAGHLMQAGKIDWVVVGADRITANGDTANKIGTYSLAVLAKHHGLKFMVVAPESTIDMQLRTGQDIPIEEREGDEIVAVKGQIIAPQGVHTFNPVFDVTPHDLIDAIVTEKGIIEYPNETKMRALFAKTCD
ncbi:methylthioribose-1-phosphate isomerase [Oleiphilus messinensis]|uniref:Methylthioribose-1-phosphate isomerase n=1 Tax=Oleiphilus messinensis TaxID=141451 RepID=A0A1Y0I9J8_9GAMM|nr:S-methyl-5-thioribose-1-phosphate isomerase [Oleiphilus messinensis]ARU57207.1 methylthioribose-1-phosphate isomerase [Oleiphilus messinensis]